MRYTLLICFVAGCGLTDDPDMRELKNSLRITGEEIVVKQDESLTILRENTTALAAIKSQVESLEASLVKSEPQPLGGDPESALEPQEPAQANQSQPAIPVASAPAVRLFVSDAPFYCPPCERLKAAIESGEFAEFDVEFIEPFTGQRAYPAIRFRDSTSATGWRVVYGYDQTTLPTIRRLA